MVYEILDRVMDEASRNAGNLDLLGGRLGLDFVNTVGWRRRAEPRFFLNSCQDLLLWAQHAVILSRHEAKSLSDTADRKPKEAKAVAEKARRLSEALFRKFHSYAEGIAAHSEDLSYFNKALSQAMAQSRIVETEEGFLWDIRGRRHDFDWILNPVIRSAAELLTASEIQRVKSCAPLCLVITIYNVIPLEGTFPFIILNIEINNIIDKSYIDYKKFVLFCAGCRALDSSFRLILSWKSLSRGAIG